MNGLKDLTTGRFIKKPYNATEELKRFHAFLDITPTCWLWTGAKKNGYGKFYSKNKSCEAHRYAYETFEADIPDGLQIDHLCKTPACVNPWHLEPVTAQENMRRSYKYWSNRTHCKYGHEYTIENTRKHASKGFRVCRTCARLTQIAYRKQLKTRKRI